MSSFLAAPRVSEVTTAALSLDILAVLEGMEDLDDLVLESDSESDSSDHCYESSSSFDADDILQDIEDMKVKLPYDDEEYLEAAAAATDPIAHRSAASMTSDFCHIIDSLAISTETDSVAAADSSSLKPTASSERRKQVLGDLKKSLIKSASKGRIVDRMDAVPEMASMSSAPPIPDDDDSTNGMVVTTMDDEGLYEMEEKGCDEVETVVATKKVRRTVDSLPFGVDCVHCEDKETRQFTRTVQSLSTEVLQLPQLCGFLHKMSGAKLKGWQKRWVIVKRTHMLWSKKEAYIDNPLDMTQRAKFQNSVTLLRIVGVSKMDLKKDKKQVKFELETVGKTYQWKAANTRERDVWFDGLRQHLHAIKMSLALMNERQVFATHGSSVSAEWD